MLLESPGRAWRLLTHLRYAWSRCRGKTEGMWGALNDFSQTSGDENAHVQDEECARGVTDDTL